MQILQTKIYLNNQIGEEKKKKKSPQMPNSLNVLGSERKPMQFR